MAANAALVVAKNRNRLDSADQPPFWPLPDQRHPIAELGKVRGTPVVIVSRSALSTILRRGITGAREIGGNEVFDVRTRLQQSVRFA